MDRLAFRARLRVLATEQGGRRQPILRGYRPSRDIRIHPLVPASWAHLAIGAEITMHEGQKLVGRATILERLYEEAP